ncbi:MAG: diguanylate cyclase [bacterium]|nr:diguanylate cyclase [bacterium]
MTKEDRIDESRILLFSWGISHAHASCPDLRSDRWTISEIDDEIDAFAAVRSKGIDLVILHMPLNDSIKSDLPNVLRRVSPAPYLPIMIMASDSAEAQRCRFLDSGVDDVIAEQTSALEVRARIRAMLRIKDLYDQLDASRTAMQLVLEREQRLMATLREDNKLLEAKCTTDPLTHLRNIRSFGEIMAHEFKSAKRYDRSLSILALDIDHFKVINDTYGHPTGDYVLKELAVILTQSVRESDVVARTGGEEFCVLLPKADQDQAAIFAERIRKEVSARKFRVFGNDIHVTVSLGQATFPENAEVTTSGMLAYFADQALLLAKDTGRDRVIKFSDIPREIRLRMRQQQLVGEGEVSENWAPRCEMMDMGITVGRI